MSSPERAPRLPVCRGCRHYQVTWDPRAPHGCRAMGFKSRRSPAEVVFESSGRICLRFAPRPEVSRGSPPARS